jgi:hypothetical protein
MFIYVMFCTLFGLCYLLESGKAARCGRLEESGSRPLLTVLRSTGRALAVETVGYSFYMLWGHIPIDGPGLLFLFVALPTLTLYFAVTVMRRRQNAL